MADGVNSTGDVGEGASVGCAALRGVGDIGEAETCPGGVRLDGTCAGEGGSVSRGCTGRGATGSTGVGEVAAVGCGVRAGCTAVVAAAEGTFRSSPLGVGGGDAATEAFRAFFAARRMAFCCRSQASISSPIHVQSVCRTFAREKKRTELPLFLCPFRLKFGPQLLVVGVFAAR